MSRTLLQKLFRTHWKRLLVILSIITFSLSLFVVITMVVDNVNQQISDQTKPLVGADIIIEWSQPLSEEATLVLTQIQSSYDIEVSRKVSFSTNITFTGVDSKLTQVRWVDGTYPLYGEIQTQKIPDSTASGVYVDAQTYSQFTTDNTIRIGTQQFTIEWIIEELPATNINLFDEWRTIIMPFSQVASTELTQLWSRVAYETLIKTNDTKQTQTLIETLRADSAFEWIYEIEDGWSRVAQITSITTEFDRFITIVLIITFVLVATTIFIAVRTFFANQQQFIAILKLLWQRNRSTLTLYGILFISCFVIGWIIACFVGRWVIGRIRSFPLTSEFVVYPAARGQAGLIGIILATISLTLPLSTITRSTPLTLLRPSSSLPDRATLWTQSIISMVGIFLIYMITLQDWFWALLFVVWGSLLIVLLAWIIWGILQAAVKTMKSRRSSKFLWFDGLRSMIAPWNQSVLMTIGILITMTALIVISAISSSFLTQLDSISQDQPSLYILNILPTDIDTITTQYPNELIYDSILSRIQAVNTIKLSEHLENLWKDGARLTREFNITSAELDVDSYIQWAAPLSGEVSLDQWFALSLGVWVGDSITFFIQWRTFDLEVTSLRESQRDWTWPFFYIQFPDPQFATAPKTYFRVADIAADKKDAFKETLLSTLWTHLSFIDTDEIIETVTDITSKLILVIRILVWCLLVFVWVSIAVCLDAMKSLKKQKVILYGLLWATPPMIRTSLRSEQITLFGVALISATLLATVVVIYSFMSSEFLQGSWWIVLQIILILIVSFGAILGMIKLMYRDIV